MSIKDKQKQRLEFALSRQGLEEPGFTWRMSGRFIHPMFPHVDVHNNVTIGENVYIGNNVIIRSGTVIGEAGFSFGFKDDHTPVHIQHTGGVLIGDNVNIGCNCCIMRGTIDNTIIGDDVHFDNFIHVAHNVKIGRGTCIADHASINGSAVIGEYSWIAPNATIANKVKIGRMVLVGLDSNVVDDIPDYAVVYGNPARIKYFHDGTIHPGCIGRKHEGNTTNTR